MRESKITNRNQIMCFLSCWKIIKGGILQSPNHQLLSDKEVEEMLRKYPELSDKFVSKKSEMDLEYRRYIQEVGSILLSDTDLREKLDILDNNDLSSGLIADELDKLKPELRSKLNEIKRAEIDRLLSRWRDLAKITDREPKGIVHLDTKNPHSFEADDLRYLLKATVDDLNKLDQMRRQAFKNHEMKKKMEEEERINAMGSEQRESYYTHKRNWAEIYRQREKQVRHPGSEEQLKDVWKHTDQMNFQDFNPTLFFRLHDMNNDGALDEHEVKALFIREISTLYKKEDPDFDPAEKEEEGERMREHFFSEADTDKDRMVTLHEFTSNLENLKTHETGWNSLFSRPFFTDEEFNAFMEKTIPAGNSIKTKLEGYRMNHIEM
ncbi:unnamed protein product [Bemisia tabaci]|uniref:EF-hand domain-containing protein n=1 Tax=Bemisia tabaci TaxID=7038 RepID=A0A9P0F3B8_BEMTA|nr:unnamed protein product [Bemisia tabaci]